MLTRCGIGKLILFDYDKVELANMNRLSSSLIRRASVKWKQQNTLLETSIQMYHLRSTTTTSPPWITSLISWIASVVEGWRKGCRWIWC
ncbi:unnamed protein product [Pleuronectes platessa]|uniref:THIF-type NAD/FAD binding fold domain-containing protein n=1 Tax=Pleuronectes platessa TaxID=8262 RepID=A0A9N7YVT2_PLEPL|nr:unnamed protein product [Pleuronectes platessa]